MWILMPLILGGILLVSLILGSLGILCTHDRRDWVPGLLFGLPTIVVSLLFLNLVLEIKILWAGIFAFPSLIIGALVVWRGFRTGQKPRDYVSALFICVSILLMGFVLVKYPDITRMIFSPFLPGAPML